MTRFLSNIEILNYVRGSNFATVTRAAATEVRAIAESAKDRIVLFSGIL